MPSPSAPAAPDSVDCIITIGSVGGVGGTDYYSSGRGAVHMEPRSLVLHVEAYGELHFAVVGTGPMPAFTRGTEAMFSVEIAGGTRKTYLVGDIADIVHGQVDFGWSIEYMVHDRRRRADRITITARDGTGSVVYNRPPTDGKFYVSSQAGLSVGAILQDILTVPANAVALDACGIGGYTGLPTTPVLPALTLADLANLTMVPPNRVSLSGECLFATLSSFVNGWHPAYVMWIDRNGIIRVTNLFSMTVNPLVVPGNSAGADPVTWPHVTADSDGCFTAIELTGMHVSAALLKTSDGSFTPVHSPNAAWTTANEAAWTNKVYNGIGDEQDAGTVSSLTANSCTVTSSSGSTHWVTNFWDQSTRQGWISLTNPIITGVQFQTIKKITSCTALSPGGSATITWDVADSVDSLAYTNYQIYGTAGGIDDVGRLFLVRDPNSGATGLGTFIGQHLLPAATTNFAVGLGSTAFLTSTEQGWVNSNVGGYPTQSLIPIEVVPALGAVRFTKPVVKDAPSYVLAKRYPANTAEGLPTDVQALVFYNRGDLSVRSPATGFSGTAFTIDNIQSVKTIRLDDAFTYPGQASQLQVLADQLLPVFSNVIVSGSIGYHGWPTAFDPLALGYALHLAVAGATSPPEWVYLPVKTVTLTWPQGTGAQHEFSFSFNTERRPLRDMSIYIHPLTGVGSVGAGGGQMPLGSQEDQAMVRSTRAATSVAPHQIMNTIGPKGPAGAAPNLTPSMPDFNPAAMAMTPEVSTPPVSNVPFQRADEAFGLARPPGFFDRPSQAADAGLTNQEKVEEHMDEIFPPAPGPAPPEGPTLADKRGIVPPDGAGG